MTLVKNKFLFIGILTFSIFAILFAYFVEHVLKHTPCNLCLIERVPYLVAIVFTSLLLFFGKYEKIILIFVGLFFALGTIVSFYHFGIEQGFFNESLVCSLNNIDAVTSTQDLLKELKTQSVSCKDVTFKIFGFSLATFNVITSFVICVIILRAGIIYGKN